MFKKQISKAAMRLMVQKGKMSLRRMEKASENPMEQNRALLMKILQANRDTEFGREHDFGGIRTIEDFKNNVPAANYEDYAPMLERMKNGEKNVLVASEILGYSRTSGSSGVPKYIPATKDSLKAYVNYTWTRALALGAKELERQGKKFVPGRGVFLSPATNDRLPDGMLCSLQSSAACVGDNIGVIAGTEGNLIIDNINNPQTITVNGPNRTFVETIRVPQQITGYEYQFLACRQALVDGLLEPREMPHAETLYIMQLMDGLRKKWNVCYPMDANY